MKKKICYFGIMFLMLFMVTGCENGETTRGIRHAGFTLLDTEFTCDEFLPKHETDTNYTKIWYFNSGRIISSEGIVFDYSSDLTFSNGKYCKRADFTKKVVAILDDTIVKADDNKLYYFTSSGSASAFSEVLASDNFYQIYKILFNDPDVMKVITVDQNAGIYYALKRDGNVYKMVITKADYNQPYVLRSSEIIYSKGVYGIIIDFNYGADLKYNYVRTNNSIHRQKASNYEECSKYADVECKYQFLEDKELIKYKDSIIVYNGSTLITSYGKMFTLS